MFVASIQTVNTNIIIDDVLERRVHGLHAFGNKETFEKGQDEYNELIATPSVSGIATMLSEFCILTHHTKRELISPLS